MGRWLQRLFLATLSLFVLARAASAQDPGYGAYAPSPPSYSTTTSYSGGQVLEGPIDNRYGPPVQVCDVCAPAVAQPLPSPPQQPQPCHDCGQPAPLPQGCDRCGQEQWAQGFATGYRQGYHDGREDALYGGGYSQESYERQWSRGAPPPCDPRAPPQRGYDCRTGEVSLSDGFFYGGGGVEPATLGYGGGGGGGYAVAGAGASASAGAYASSSSSVSIRTGGGRGGWGGGHGPKRGGGCGCH